jgi:hypothetical protein
MIATLRRGKRPHITKLGDERKICKDYPGFSDVPTSSIPVGSKLDERGQRLFARLPSLLNGALVDHATDLRQFAAYWNPPGPSHSDA